ncbi:hypothetical protein CK503_13320 [Aliifodinibius salipaludis]|uniref:Uncharacterized protein n=1 Tax=Fodinibius salipaludis TaxID=2032627 RepID=A0A2A2G7N9_9BACT|nr:hypothetical protein [Aliifodinibius salipaludis]PAU93140.1 hypothetical protein CK503_13320 [Aliifodinibius salipaludis]
MVTKILKIVIVLLLPSVALGQSLNVSVAEQTADNNRTTFTFGDSKITFGSQSVRFLDTNTEQPYDVVGVSPDKTMISTLTWDGQEEGEITLYNTRGEKLNAFSTVSLADEASFGLYPFKNGNTLLRDKIANFTFYDSFGEIVTSMSSSSQSKQGEAISEVARSVTGNTIVIYNPKIKRNGELGSKAQVRTGVKEFEDIFFSSDRYLKNVTVSKYGTLIAAITAKQGTDDRVLIMDKYGNELNTISAEEDLKGVRFTNNLENITIYSGGRVMVHNTLSGESLGATSVRSPIITADYFPEDDLILALTGNYSERSEVVNNVEFRAINLQQRSMASKQFSRVLGLNKAIELRLVRNSGNSYMLEGANKNVLIRANF